MIDLTYYVGCELAEIVGWPEAAPTGEDQTDD